MVETPMTMVSIYIYIINYSDGVLEHLLTDP